ASRVVSREALRRATGVYKQDTRRARPRLRHKLSLVLLLIALAVLVAAIAGPRASENEASRTVIVLDRSASMGTRDADGVRLERAARAVADLAAAAPDGSELALVLAGGEAGVAVAPTRSH